MKKLLTIAVFGLFIIIFSMGFNIVAHEFGHYMIAESFNYEPEMHFNTPLTNESKTFEIDAALAYVSYSSYTLDITTDDAYIAFAGPFVNLILGTMFLIFYISSPRKHSLLGLSLLVFTITSFVAGFSNLYPLGSSDGAIIFQYLRNI